MANQVWIATALTFMTLGVGSPVHGDVPDRAALRKMLEPLWDSINTLDLECETYALDTDGVRVPNRTIQSLRLIRASGARMALTHATVKSDGDRRIFEAFREDGRRRYVMQYIEGHAQWLSQVGVQSQTNDDRQYQGSFNCILWLLMPGGRPAFDHLGPESMLENLHREGKPRLVINTVHRSMKLRIFLDPEHDYLASRVELEPQGQPLIFWDVSRFDRDNGRWYPAEGTYLQATEATPLLAGFKVTRCSINRPVEDSLFEMPPLPDGAFLNDEVARKKMTIRRARSPGANDEALPSHVRVTYPQVDNRGPSRRRSAPDDGPDHRGTTSSTRTLADHPGRIVGRGSLGRRVDPLAESSPTLTAFR